MMRPPSYVRQRAGVIIVCSLLLLLLSYHETLFGELMPITDGPPLNFNFNSNSPNYAPDSITLIAAHTSLSTEWRKAVKKCETTMPVARADTEWWTQRFQLLSERARKQGGNTELLLLGDSITHYAEEVSLWESSLSKYHPVNLGIEGDRTQHLLYRLQNGNLENVNVSCKYATLLIGTNNARGGDTAAEIVDGIRSILQVLHARLPHTKVLLMLLFPRNNRFKDSAGEDESWSGEPSSSQLLVQQVNDLLRPFDQFGIHHHRHHDLYDDHTQLNKDDTEDDKSDTDDTQGRAQSLLEEEKAWISVVDLTEDFLRRSNASEGQRSWRMGSHIVALNEAAFKDGLHLSPLGYQVWADALLQRIRRIEERTD